MDPAGECLRGRGGRGRASMPERRAALQAQRWIARRARAADPGRVDRQRTDKPVRRPEHRRTSRADAGGACIAVPLRADGERTFLRQSVQPHRLEVGSVDARQQLGEDSSVVADTVAAFVIERLMEWGIFQIYNYPGEGIDGITAALC